MKKNHFLIFLFFAFVQSAYAQKPFQYGFSVGLRQSFVSGIEQTNGSVTNWQFGAKLIFSLKNRLSLQLLPNANTQGWTDEAPSINRFTNQAYPAKNRFSILNAEVPLVLAYHWDYKKSRFSGLFGAQYSYITHVTATQTRIITPLTHIEARYDTSDRFVKHLYGLTGGISYQTLTKPAFFTDLRYYHTLNNLMHEKSASSIFGSLQNSRITLMGFSLSAGLLF